jgi:uncharacterized cupredoxin-like copper-binding protein
MLRVSAMPLTLAMILAACGQSAPSTGDTRRIEIEMRDFAFAPETLTLRAGEKVTLAFKNVGKLEHEFMAGTDPAYGKGYLKDWLAGAQIESSGEHGMEHAGAGVRVAPNTTKLFTFVVPNQGGVFEFGCFVIGHYESGMHGRLVVDVDTAPNGAPAGQETGHHATPSAAPTHAPMGDDDGEGH